MKSNGTKRLSATLPKLLREVDASINEMKQNLEDLEAFRATLTNLAVVDTADAVRLSEERDAKFLEQQLDVDPTKVLDAQLLQERMGVRLASKLGGGR